MPDDAVEPPALSRAIKVAKVVARKDNDEFIKAGKLVEVRFVKGQSLSLSASRLLALMILTAGGDAWEDRKHRIRKADIRRGHKGNERIADMLEELHRTLFAEDDLSWRGRRATRRFSLIQTSWEEVEESGTETGWLEWQFTPDARRLIQESETYAVLNRQAVLGFRSAYALKLYEQGALRLHRRMPIWRIDVIGLRAALGIDPEKYGDFAQLRRKVLDVAKKEIDQLAHFTAEWREIKAGRAVSELEFSFRPKAAPEQLDTLNELDRHSAGRKARRDQIVDKVIVASPSVPLRSGRSLAEKPWERFPLGVLQYGPTEEAARAIGRRYGGGWDVDIIANAYREQMGARLEGLSGGKLEKSWKGFCEAFYARRGRP